MKSKSPSRSNGSPAKGGMSLTRSAIAAISAVEGLKLSKAGRKRVYSAEPTEVRRLEILRAYVPAKKQK